MFAGVKCFMPANGETVTIPILHPIPIDVSLNLLKHDTVSQGMLVPACSVVTSWKVSSHAKQSTYTRLFVHWTLWMFF